VSVLWDLKLEIFPHLLPFLILLTVNVRSPSH
jgi:hypothetical protein